MSRAWWRSPWPQWRSHWHVLHAWPASAQALLLLSGTLVCTALVSALYSGEAWQAWWQAEEEAVAWQQSLQILQNQVQAHQAQVRVLQAQAHPSGLHLPAWQMQAPVQAGPDLRAAWAQWAQVHGLQAKVQGDDNRVAWVGSLPQLLAAWQQWPAAMAQHAVDSFELSASPGSNLLQLSVTWRPWSSAQALKVSQPVAVVDTAVVLHNPFAIQGLRMALPDAAHRPVQGVWRGVPLTELHWVGMLSQGDQTQALVAHAGLVRQVSLGQAMGQDFGEVVHMAADHLLLREWHVNAQGQWQMQTTRFPDKSQP